MIDWIYDYEVARYAALVAVLCFGILVQSAVGFAAGLLIVPLLIWCGYTVPSAMVSMLVATIPQNIWGVWSLRRQIEFRELVVPGLARLSFLPVGIYSLSLLQNQSPTVLRQVVAMVVLLATLAILFARPVPRLKLHPGWAWLAFPLSGFSQGLVGMGGPPLVLWVQAHDWSTERSRGFLFAMYLISLAPALTALYVAFGDAVLPAALAATVVIPLLWPVTSAGLWIGTRMGRERLRIATIVLLLLIGLSGLLSPWIRS